MQLRGNAGIVQSASCVIVLEQVIIMFHLGYYTNRYAGWYSVIHFHDSMDLIHWLKDNAKHIDGAIDFISFK